MARRTERAVQPARSHARRRTRAAATTRRLSGSVGGPAAVPQPREDADRISSQHPIMHWVLVTDDDGRTRPEARWL
ncbi:hypothetical protein [Nocardiopsis xinjiangensis]|uniref:hypothetical protein n=1 Tax=Nocardiopsis xinjiangensis TaxID=124285 RepID=UPI000476D8CC|nr:hypothetical protein [Nocardiopsis xinjiangensis]